MTTDGPVWICDNALPAPLVHAVNATWPHALWRYWVLYDNGKRATKSRHDLTAAADQALRRMAELPIDDITEKMDVFPDLELHGAGMHVIPPGKDLWWHRDADHQPQTGWSRVLSAVLHVNPTWDAAHGGKTEVADGKQWVEVSPKFNRMVIVSGEHWHRVQPVFGQERRTLALFWWSEREGSRLRPRSEFREYP